MKREPMLYQSPLWWGLFFGGVGAGVFAGIKSEQLGMMVTTGWSAVVLVAWLAVRHKERKGMTDSQP
jgi:hypothetical protein